MEMRLIKKRILMKWLTFFEVLIENRSEIKKLIKRLTSFEVSIEFDCG